MSFRITTLVGIVCALVACEGAQQTSSGGTAGADAAGGQAGVGGVAGYGGEIAGAAGATTGGTGGGTTTTSTTSGPTCTDLACAGQDCGQALYDCDGDGKEENHLCPDTCQAPAACGGNYTQNECGTKCQVLPEYLEACGFGVEFACDVECGYCYQYIGGEAVYKTVGWECPVVETMGDPGPMMVRCCKGGCCT